MIAPIVSLDLVELQPGGGRVPIRIELQYPQPDGRGAWACNVMVEPFTDQPREIYGEDSLQALYLGLRLVRMYLELVLEGGSQLHYSNEDSPFPLDAYFQR